MPEKNDLIDAIRKEMRDKMKQLQPAVDEYARIQAALRRLDAKAPGRKPKNKAA